MLKQVLCISSAVVLASLVCNAAVNGPDAGGVQHPLEATIRSLAKASTDLSEVSAQNVSDKELQAEIGTLKQRVSSISSDALMAPLRVLEPKLTKLGFDYRLADRRTNVYVFKQNSSFVSLQDDAGALKVAKWIDLENLIEQSQKNIKTVVHLADDSEIKKALAPQDYNSVYFQSAGKRDALNMLKENAEMTIDCISFFTKSAAESGLRVTEASPNNFGFSPEDLGLKYGVKRISDMSSSQKQSVKKFLKQMIDESPKYEGTCVTVDKEVFFTEQYEAL